MTESTKEAFRRLRPCCVQLTKQQTVQNVSELRKLLEETAEEDVQQLQEYALFPLRIVLKQKQRLHERLTQAVLECMTHVFQHTQVHHWDMLEDTFTQLCVLLSSPSNNGQVADLSEEVKLAVVTTLKSLLLAADSSLLVSLYSVKYLPLIGHAVSVLLALAEQEGARKLRLETMECLMVLAGCHSGCEHLTPSLERQIADSFASFLPGITMTLCRVIMGDAKQGHAVTVCATEAWSSIVTMVMSDSSVGDSQSQQSMESCDVSERLRSLQVRRTEDWCNSTADKLKVLVQRIAGAVSHPNWRVRLALVEFAHRLLSRCNKTLQCCTAPLLQLLVSQVGDDYPQVSDRCTQVLTRYADKHLGSRPLVELLEENLHSLATSLPRLMRAADDEKKLSTLTLTQGYLKLLGSRVATLLNSAPHLRRLSMALLQVLEMDITDVKIVGERTPGGGLPALSVSKTMSPVPLESPPAGQYVPSSRTKRFRHFRDARVYDLLRQICQLLGYYGDLSLLVDHFQDLYQQSALHRKQAVLILNQILLGSTGTELPDVAARPPSEETADIICSLLEEYVSPKNWHLPTSSQSEYIDISNTPPDWSSGTTLPLKNSSDWLIPITSPRPHQISLKTLNSNILLICLQLEGIAVFSKVLGENFKLLLIQSLYPVLEKLGDESAVISDTAHSTLVSMCESCGYSSVAQLIAENADYLVNDISLSLRHYSLHPRAPHVLRVMLDNSDKDILPLGRDTIEEILLALDRHHEDRSVSFIRVLQSLVTAINRWFPGNKNEEANQRPSRPTWAVEGTQSIRDFLVEYHQTKKVADGLLGDDDITVVEHDGKESAEDAGKEEAMEEADRKAEVPAHIKNVLEVLARCRHLMSSGDPRLRLQVLDVTCEGLTALRDNPDHLLPQVHQLWQPFTHRLEDPEPLVILKAFETLCMMGRVCGDFIRKRVVKEVWPKVTTFLTNQAKISMKTGPAYTHTVAHRLQSAILAGLGPLCLQLGVGETEVEMIACACIPYLSARQPTKLQEGAFGVFDALIQLEPDAVWLILCDVYCPVLPQPPHPCFSHVKVSGSASEKSEYANNVTHLLEKLR
ncbi:TELO2-interacting protein 1 homolog [Branchiostoma floridae]|uniref:TELO2-interacting protein 1 homolog n=1 Tax=Branchiostoma floridae TaxID=7739 RepID=A0A9J7MAI1_BRAFL|nr:TELO2-interacting protein 1 homolog [Branchiostoma floridae]